MSVAEWCLSGIWAHHHWTPFTCSNHLSSHAINLTCTQGQFFTATPVSLFVQCHISFRPFALVSHDVYLSKCSVGNHVSVAQWADTYGIHHWRIFWMSYRKLFWGGFEPTNTKPCLDALSDWAMTPWVQLPLRPNFVQPLQFHNLFSVTFHFGRLPSSVATFIYLKFSGGSRMSVAEWDDTYGIGHWRVLWSSYRKLLWKGFEPTTTEPRSDALTNWAIRPWF